MTELEDLVGQGRNNLSRLHAVAASNGFTVTDIDWEMPGVGFGVFLSNGHFAVLSQEFGDWNVIYLTAGIRRDIPVVSHELLLATNALTRGNTAYPVFVHSGETHDILTQAKLPISVLENDIGFLVSLINGLSVWIGQVHSNLPATGGSPYALGANDRVRLHIRSLT